MILIDGKKISAQIRAEVRAEVESLRPAHGRAPGLTVILVGDDPGSQVYVRNKEKACAEVGFASEAIRLPASTAQAELEALIDRLNADAGVDGILLQLPLPKGLNSQALLERIDPGKDVDGFHPDNVGRLVLGLPGFLSCTPAGVIELLRRYGLSPRGKRAVVIGRSNIVGKPLAALLARPGEWGDATVTLCHSRTADLAAHCREADFVFAAVGRPRMIGPDMVKPGAVVIDVGMNRTEQGLAGDCDFEALTSVASAMTPVPGGVGPMTIAMLLRNTLLAYRRHVGEPEA
ncbi:MAG: bifunctional methylenetetrahydrofolate dehydrogenase/methenyltetrahydrofolate cyclohydrolase FolD [Desulfovibrionaceae bacterium]